MCKTPYSAVLTNPSGSLVHVVLPCKRWCCSDCARDILRPFWEKHLLSIVENNMVGLWRGVYQPAEWERVRNYATRNKIHYFRLKVAGSIVAYAERAIPNSMWIDRKYAERSINKEVQELWQRQKGEHLVRVCRDWVFRSVKRAKNSVVAFGVQQAAFLSAALSVDKRNEFVKAFRRGNSTVLSGRIIGNCPPEQSGKSAWHALAEYEKRHNMPSLGGVLSPFAA